MHFSSTLCITGILYLIFSLSMSVFISSKKISLSGKHAIFWDVDGTLCDSYKLGFTSTNRVLEVNGHPLITESDYHSGTKLTTPRRLAWHTTGNPDDPSGLKLGQQFDDLYVGLVSQDTAPFYNGMKNLVESISQSENLKQGALSNACGSYVRAVMTENRVSHCFELQLGADEVPAAKPSPLGLLQLCKELNCPPAACVYIGDSPSDGEAAKAAGMFGIGVTWGSHPVETVTPAFERVVHSVDELQRELINWLSSREAIAASTKSVVTPDGMMTTSSATQKVVSWGADVIDNEGMGKKKTDDEFW